MKQNLLKNLKIKKNNQKAILTVLRENVFFDLIINNSLGCKFLTTNNEETEKIKGDFAKKENYDLDELKEFVAMRDIFRRYDVFDNSNSLLAGVFLQHGLLIIASGGFFYCLS